MDPAKLIDTQHLPSLPRGFDLRSVPPELRQQFTRTNLAVSAGLAVGCHTGIAALAAATLLVQAEAGLAVGSICYAAAMPCIAALMRWLENMVHDASHTNWHRADHDLNDLAANLLAAWPMGMSVQSYRPPHMRHHRHFGGADDPCRRRMAETRDDIRRRGHLRALLRYAGGFYVATAGKPVAALRALAWHAAAVVAPASLLLGGGQALLAWLAFWLLPMLTVLAVLRMPAENHEHAYDADSEQAGTISHVGGLVNAFLHPGGDGYHWLHHAVPTVPMVRLPALHRWLILHSAQYRGSRNNDGRFVEPQEQKAWN